MAETMIAMVMLGIIASLMMSILRPGDIKSEILQKAGSSGLVQIDFASKHNIINTLPVIKQYSTYDVDTLQKMEMVMKKRYWILCFPLSLLYTNILCLEEESIIIGNMPMKDILTGIQ